MTIVQELKNHINMLNQALSTQTDLDNHVLENIYDLIQQYINHSDYIIEEQAIILSNLFDKYNSIEL